MKYYLFLFFLFIGFKIQAQTTQTHTAFDSLLCKEWKLVSVEAEGKTTPADAEQEKDRMIFYFDHTAKSIDAGIVEMMKWTYDPKTTIMTITPTHGETIVLKVLSISKVECSMEFSGTEPEEGSFIMHMAPATN
ncbi:MAG: hypothetical protein KG003_13680 [Bacteroidetes bacterium]|nr:hypothetical protein [Bacteroidota bacterium]